MFEKSKIKEFIMEYKKGIMIATIILILLVFSLVSNTKAEKEESKLNDEYMYEEKVELLEKNKSYIHLDGAINEPGMIEVKEGDRLKNAIEKAGGLKDDADLKYINFAMILSDGEKIYIPFKNSDLNIGNAGLSHLPETKENKR